MRLTCPCCGATNSLEALLNDAAARRAVAAALALPAGLGGRLLRYLGLFRPPQRGLTWDRAAKLLDELNNMIAAGQIERHGRLWPAPHDYWRLALDEILDRRTLTLPLKSHGYLLEILAGLSNQAEARAEADEDARRHRPRAGGERGPQLVAERLAALVPHPPLPPGDGPGAKAPPDPAGLPPLAVHGEGGRGGEVQPRPAYAPPPPDFRALIDRLRGKLAPPDPPEEAPPC